VRLRLSDQLQFILRAEGVKTLECMRPRDERDCSRALQPDVMIGWVDSDKVEPFIHSGWMIPGQVPLGATAPAAKWHLRVNLRGSPPVYLNVQLDPMRRRTTITREAARVRVSESGTDFPLILPTIREDGASQRTERTRLSERTSGGQQIRQKEGQMLCWMRQVLAIWQSTSEPDGRAKRRSMPRASAQAAATGTGGSVL
jgi:hypothetical protein